MSKSSHVIRRGAVLAVLALMLLPAEGLAHALFADHDPNRPVAEYLWIGFVHMAGGWDHLLFIAGVVLIAGALRPAAKVVSLFVAGHSLTLLVATLAGWKLDATAVDIVIALSLVYVGAQGLSGRPHRLAVLGVPVFAFGLVHGLGLSTRLQDLGLPEDGLVIRVLVFNAGVEIGQLFALGIIFGLGTLIVRRLRLPEDARQPAFAALIAAGLLATALLSLPGDDDDATRSAGESTPAAAAETACTSGTASPPQGFGGGHPSKMYFGPEEPAPEVDLTHVIGDGLVIVRYQPELPAADHEAIEAFVAGTNPPYVIAAADPEQEEPLRAVTALRTLSCDDVAIDELTAFRDAWIAEVRARQGG